MSSASPQPSWDEMHYRLVSLWGLLMHVFDTQKFLATYNLLNTISAAVMHRKDMLEGGYISPSRQVLKDTEALAVQLEELGLPMSALSARDVLDAMKRKAMLEDLQSRIDILDGRITDELGVRSVLVVPASKHELFTQEKPLFGEVVDAKFKRLARPEISEAGKCLALGRYTACVFHLMRAVEIGMEAIRTCLGLPQPAKGQHKAWGAALDAIKKEMEARDKLGHVRQWTDLKDRKFFDEVYMSLIAIKDGCRDDTMHVESTYTEDEAVHLFAMTKGFMQKVASRLDEDGQPLA